MKTHESAQTHNTSVERLVHQQNGHFNNLDGNDSDGAELQLTQTLADNGVRKRKAIKSQQRRQKHMSSQVCCTGQKQQSCTIF